MLNAELLREKITERGLMMKYVADQIGLTYQGFQKKLNNQSEFKLSEIQKITDLLNLSTQERESIFFTLIVH